MPIPWPLRSLIAGAAGVATMSLAYALEHRLRPRHTSPVDYDDSPVPGEIVANILMLSSVTTREDYELGMALRWSYGSSFALLHGLLRRRLREPHAAEVFGTALITLTFTMFPLLGHTPPPWRWSRGVLLTCVGTHAVYVATVAIVDDRSYDS
jgi:hypothetical protein